MGYLSIIKDIAERNAAKCPRTLQDSADNIPPSCSVLQSEHDALELIAGKKSLKLQDMLREMSAGGTKTNFKTANEALCYTIMHSDPRWTSVLLPKVEDRFIYNKVVFAILSNSICGGGKVLAKCTLGFHEEFAGVLLNSIIDKAPGFVYTYGNKPCEDTYIEGINCLPSFPKPKRYSESYWSPRGGYVDLEWNQLLTEYISDSVTLTKWLEDIRSEEEIIFIFLQILSNISVANKHLSFVHGDLHSGNILIRKVDKSIVPAASSLLAYDFPYEARIVDYGLSTFCYKGKVYIGDTMSPTNHQDVWTDIFKLIVSCWMYSVTNRTSLEKIGLHFLGLKDDLEYYALNTHPFFVSPPHSNIFDGLPDIDTVIVDMSASLDFGYETLGDPHASETVTISEKAKVALGIEKDRTIVDGLLGRFIEIFRTFLDFVEDLEGSKVSQHAVLKALKNSVSFLQENAQPGAHKEELETVFDKYKMVTMKRPAAPIKRDKV